MSNAHGIPKAYAFARLGWPVTSEAIRGAEYLKDAPKSILEALRVVLSGPTGSGKSIFAAALIRMVEFGVFMPTQRIRSTGTKGSNINLTRCLNAPTLVVDGLGDENMHPDSLVTEVISQRRAQAMRTWVTTTLTVDGVSERYGDGIARRVFEGAKVVKLG